MSVAVTEGSVDQLEHYRAELRGYCYRMLGSAFDADDAVQETLVKAWQAFDRFEGRSSLRSWLYRIATNVCLDTLRGRERRALPMDLSMPVPATTHVGDPLPKATWIEPIPDPDVVPLEGDPAQRAVFQESVRLAFIAALQSLPPRQRAVLILREVLCWQAAEVAELLDTSVASVNSALQRARATLGASDLSEGRRPAELDAADQALLARYVTAFEAYDIESLVRLLHEDASISMPPLALWLKGSTMSVPGISAPESAARARVWCRHRPTDRRDSASTASRRPEVSSRGRSRCWRSKTGRSRTSTISWTPRSSPDSDCRPGSSRSAVGCDCSGKTEVIQQWSELSPG